MNREKKNLLVFGYGLVIICSFIVFRHWIKAKVLTNSDLLLLAIALGLLLLTTLKYSWLKPIYTVWMRIAHFIGGIISTIILTIIFYFIFGLVGIALRMIKKDLLDEQIDLNQVSYWKTKETIGHDRERYTKQY